MRILNIVMAFLSIFIMAGIGNAALVYSSFTDTPSYTGDWQITNQGAGSDAAGKFSVTGTDYFLDSIEMYIRDFNNVSPDFISLSIVENDTLNNIPSSTIILPKTSFNVDIPNTYTRVIFDPVASPVLNSGTDYWLIASVADESTVPLMYYWTSNRDLPSSAQLAFRTYSGNWGNVPYWPLTYQINGTEVPLPGAVWLVFSGLIGIVCIRKKLK